MTPERARLLEAVAEAAWRIRDMGRSYRGAGFATAWVEEIEQSLWAPLDALRAHDAAPQVVGETVEIMAWVSRSESGQTLNVFGASHDGGRKWHGAAGAVSIAIITARVPLPVVPVIPAAVEEVKR